MNKDFKYFEEMGDFMDLENPSSTNNENEINVEFCKCFECKSEFMLDEGETIERCPECNTIFDDQGEKT